ncbi:MAG: pyridoxal-phosphate dependent enzyme [Ardenticatenales bacterium]|nr:pyridoxal-phosphate dependent enzyme [Ardenticatenales bacterium]
MSHPYAIPLADIEAARERIAGSVIRTPLIRLNVDDAPADIYLKLENLQPIGSFKLRGAGNAIAMASPEQLKDGVYTASAGNMAQGVAWNARRLGLPCTVIVPDHAPETKLAAIRRLGGEIIKVTFDEWWQIILTHEFPGQKGYFIHPVSEPAVMAGNGTIGLEILEDLPDVDAVITPYGGGGLTCGVASAFRALKPDTKLFAAEVDTAAPLAPSLAAGHPVEVDYTPSFVDGIGGKGILPEIWPRVSNLLDGSLVVSLEQIAAALRLMLERNRVLAEGAGAAPVAAALAGLAGGGKVVCVVSGGNIDVAKLVKILAPDPPGDPRQ